MALVRAVQSAHNAAFCGIMAMVMVSVLDRSVIMYVSRLFGKHEISEFARKAVTGGGAEHREPMYQE